MRCGRAPCGSAPAHRPEHSLHALVRSSLAPCQRVRCYSCTYRPAAPARAQQVRDPVPHHSAWAPRPAWHWRGGSAVSRGVLRLHFRQTACSAQGRELVRDGASRLAGRPVSAVLRSRILPRLPRATHAGQGARGGHPDRAGGRHAAADCCEGASRRNWLIQEACQAGDRRGSGRARRRGGRARQAAVSVGRCGPSVSDQVARAVRPGDERGDGLRDARDRLPGRIGTGGRRRRQPKLPQRLRVRPM